MIAPPHSSTAWGGSKIIRTGTTRRCQGDPNYIEEAIIEAVPPKAVEDADW